jgi:hypothetical protein
MNNLTASQVAKYVIKTGCPRNGHGARMDMWDVLELLPVWDGQITHIGAFVVTNDGDTFSIEMI